MDAVDEGSTHPRCLIDWTEHYTDTYASRKDVVVPLVVLKITHIANGKVAAKLWESFILNFLKSTHNFELN